MIVNEISAKSILRRQKKIDSWFVSRFGMNFYRGCEHNCAYCDGRAEKYQVTGEFGEEIAVKVNAVEVLQRELDANRRKPLKGGYFFVGGGVCDSYQPAEIKYGLTRKALLLLQERRHPVHLLTKSQLIERDLDLICELNAAKRAIVSMSFSSADDRISAVFEPNVPPPSRRLKTLKKFKDAGVPIGIYLMPVLPFITDTDEQLEASLRAAKNIGVDFVIFGGLTLKGGRQQQHFFNMLGGYNASFVPRYQALYPGSAWGGAVSDYTQAQEQRFYKLAKSFGIPIRIPSPLWLDLLDENDRLIVFLEHIDYLLKMRGEKSFFGRAAYSISQLEEPVSAYPQKLEQLQGVGRSTAGLIHELLDRGTATYYEWLMYGKPG
jgi:DNA repair photolyase